MSNKWRRKTTQLLAPPLKAPAQPISCNIEGGKKKQVEKKKKIKINKEEEKKRP